MIQHVDQRVVCRIESPVASESRQDRTRALKRELDRQADALASFMSACTTKLPRGCWQLDRFISARFGDAKVFWFVNHRRAAAGSSGVVR